MSELVVPPESPDAAALPPVLDPAAFEAFAVFRETFLVYLTEPRCAAAVRTVGEWLFEMVLECYGKWPAWSESATRVELRAALADARQLEGFLASVGREHEVSALADDDARLSQLAAAHARELARLADRLEDALGALS